MMMTLYYLVNDGDKKLDWIVMHHLNRMRQ